MQCYRVQDTANDNDGCKIYMKIVRSDKTFFLELSCANCCQQWDVANKCDFTRNTVGQIPQKCKETSNLMWLSLISYGLFLFGCLFVKTYFANLRIKCVTETKNVSVLFNKNIKSSFLNDSHYGNTGCGVFKRGVQN